MGKKNKKSGPVVKQDGISEPAETAVVDQLVDGNKGSLSIDTTPDGEEAKSKCLQDTIKSGETSLAPSEHGEKLKSAQIEIQDLNRQLEEYKQQKSNQTGPTDLEAKSYKLNNQELQSKLNAVMSELNLTKKQLKESQNDTRPSQPFPNNDELSHKISELQTEVQDAHRERDRYKAQYQDLSEKVGRIKTGVAEKLKRDADELKQSESRVSALNEENKKLSDTIEMLKKEIIDSNKESDTLSRELSALRSDYERAIGKWENGREHTERELRQLNDKLDVAENLSQSLSSALTDEKSLRSSLATKVHGLGEQITSQTGYAERYRKERDSVTVKYTKLESDFSDYKKTKTQKIEALQQEVADLADDIKNKDNESDALKQEIQVLEAAQQNVSKLQSQLKERQLQIGKLRHEAVTLNEHLTKALRVIKENSQGDTVDRQLVTNMLLSFVTLPRADTKRFEILQLIANYLSWDDDQKSQAGLCRPGTSGSTNSGYSTASTASLLSRAASYDSGTSGGGFMSMFADFLERESSKRS